MSKILQKNGFIGLGQMGGRMAANLLKKSRAPLVVYDKSPQALTEFLNRNKLYKDKITVAHSPAHVAQLSNFIMCMLPQTEHVQDAYDGPEGITKAAKLQKELTIVESSTVDTTKWRKLAKYMEQSGKIRMLDAPVSGGILGAEDATLCFMVGSSTKAGFEKAKPTLGYMGKNVIHCGNRGSGQVAKLCNNMILAATMISVSESMNLGINAGMDPKTLLNVFNVSTGKSWVTENYSPVPGVHQRAPSSNNYKAGFKTSLVLKDLTLAQKLAEEKLVNMPLNNMIKAFFHKLMYHNSQNSEGADKDFSYAYDYMKNYYKLGK